MTSRGDLAPSVMGWIGTGANYLEKYLLSMVLNPTVGLYVRNFIFFFYKQNPVKFQSFELFLAKNSIWAYISL